MTEKSLKITRLRVGIKPPYNYICFMTTKQTWFGYYFFYYFFGKRPGFLLLKK